MRKLDKGWYVDERNRWYFKTYFDKYLRECYVIPTIVYRSSSTGGHDNWRQLNFKWLFFSFGFSVEFGKEMGLLNKMKQ